ncbi:SsgA family sporulation/cell division regulator [Kitasatospora purpeofusca]|uniref:SsgA family sporulation/cell division regulator n=1 Tax=Kitasatospora purpeofusca TaxID=67352 RepID=UPI0035E32EC5
MDLITARTEMRLQTGPDTFRAVKAELSYSPSDPYAVRCLFPDEASPVSWAFARELLAMGLFTGSGDGDVHIEPVDRHRVHLAFSDGRGAGVALLQASARDLVGFLVHTYEAVPLGSEDRHVDWDTCIGLLLDRGYGSTTP